MFTENTRKTRVRFYELLTKLKEIENVCNCRPVTYIYDDDVMEPLSPAHLNPGRAITTTREDIVNMKETDVNQPYRYLQSLIEHFWRRQSDEYLKELREQQRIISRTKIFREAHVNDVVLLNNDKTPRSQWKTKKILELIKSNDIRLHGAIVMPKKNGTEHLIKRPLNRSYPLELDKKDEDVKIRFVDDANYKMMQKADTER